MRVSSGRSLPIAQWRRRSGVNGAAVARFGRTKPIWRPWDLRKRTQPRKLNHTRAYGVFAPGRPRRTRGGSPAPRYRDGVLPLRFGNSITFIVRPPGITMSPGFWSGLQGPIHFASILLVVSRAPPGPPSLCDTVVTV